MADTVLIPIQVCYASPEETWVLDIEVPLGISVVQALGKAGLVERFAGEIEQGHIGIYGRKVPVDTILAPYDRIEVYRPLADLPQNIRRRRVEQKRAQKGSRR
ncbi:MAG: RnfH family protein [Oxalobacter sp.]|nr:RnfH family protein [Oxalobacter sp.]